MGSCSWMFHKWNKWEEYIVNLSKRDISQTSNHYVETRKRRSCSLCGYVEDVSVSRKVK